ncbi:hypothetical protein [uncultured Flavonifractor sp.]|uniref:hypothetical protein n=1 Tax=uncultured Flavonifractor sp. TaxID=1193534 RepID=UPI002599EB45|nr:hypothetical protein [uncultured Flavonifractor sp.]
MSMDTYPTEECAAFFIDEEAARAIWAGLFPEDDGDGGYDPEEDLPVLAEQLDEFRWASSFDGQVNTLFPERAKEALQASFEDDYIVFIPCERAPDLFYAAYESPEKLLEEFQEVFKEHGIELPEGFDWWKRIVSIDGTIFC